MSNNKYPLLKKINSPTDLKKLSPSEIPALNFEIRSFLIENVMETGGHLASNLGAVELSVAIHRVFDSPTDRIIFDVGHQSYIHKIITGRKDDFPTLRQAGGLSGFTKPSESPHDPFGAGHSSTSISAALGFAEADRLAGRDNYTVAIIGDGAMTGGMAYEALNNCDKNLKLIIILNENEMSISRNIGAFANYIAKIRSSPKYLNTKQHTQSTVTKIPLIGDKLYDAMRNTKQTVKDMMYHSNFFEELGLFYLGPIDGNDYRLTERVLRVAKAKGESVIVHLKTRKGCGYVPAERDPNKYHGVAPRGHIGGSNFSSEMGKKLIEMAREDDSICAITAAMAEGTGLSGFSKVFPKRFFDVGIAEQHALTFAAALAAAGMKPFFAVYSSFLQRGYDSCLHDITLQKLPVTLLVDRAGLAAADGPTHHGIFDVAFISHMPNTEIFVPATFESLGLAMREAAKSDKLSIVRYPNCTEPTFIYDEFLKGKSTRALAPKANYGNKNSKKCVIITYGLIAKEALRAEKLLAEKSISCGVILLEKLKPYDETAAAVGDLLPEGEALIVFLEEGIYNGGAGMLLFDKLKNRHHDIMANKTTKIIAIDDNFAPSEKGESKYTYAGISAEDVLAAAKKHFFGE